MPDTDTSRTAVFAIRARDAHSYARTGSLHTPHGDIATPTYMPVATHATVKALAPDEVRAAGGQIIISNTYHLYLSPGPELVQEMGGLAAFMKWNGPTITDSGGYQVSYMWHGAKANAANGTAPIRK